jgi:hypothetical protein
MEHEEWNELAIADLELMHNMVGVMFEINDGKIVGIVMPKSWKGKSE